MGGNSDRGSRRYPSAVARILVIDNYDSFVYNLVQYLGQLGAEPLGLPQRRHRRARRPLLSEPDGGADFPGPGHRRPPASARVSAEFAGVSPVLGCASVTSASVKPSVGGSCGRA